MIDIKASLRLLAPLVITLAVGCAPAYRSYSGCYVDCKYCALPPLPYTHYDGGACHSYPASTHLSLQPQPVRRSVVDPDSNESID